MLAAAYEINNKHDKAVSVLEQALQVNPNSDDAKRALEELKYR